MRLGCANNYSQIYQANNYSCISFSTTFILLLLIRLYILDLLLPLSYTTPLSLGLLLLIHNALSTGYCCFSILQHPSLLATAISTVTSLIHDDFTYYYILHLLNLINNNAVTLVALSYLKYVLFHPFPTIKFDIVFLAFKLVFAILIHHFIMHRVPPLK